jgi:hypothetical protein
MKRLVLLALVAVSLGAVPLAAAGGWATAGLEPPPGGLGPGDTWNAEVTILQHGQTPLMGVKPTVTIRNDAGKALTFNAKPTGKPGVYRAKVKFPSAGTWRYEVYDGFTQYGGAKTHTFGPVTVGPDSGGSGIPLWLVLLAIAAVLVAVTVVVAPRLVRPRLPAAARR